MMRFGFCIEGRGAKHTFHDAKNVPRLEKGCYIYSAVSYIMPCARTPLRIKIWLTNEVNDRQLYD